jgi:hypothetical protein
VRVASHWCSPGVQKLDKALKKWGFPVGPITLNDEVGSDVAYHVAKFLSGHLGERMGVGRPAPLMPCAPPPHPSRRFTHPPLLASTGCWRVGCLSPTAPVGMLRTP